MRERQRLLGRGKRSLPTLWLLTDERVAEERLLRGAARLPRGSGIILRHYCTAPTDRHALFLRLRKIAVRRGLVLFLAGSEAQAQAWGADGFHARPSRFPSRLPMSAPVHDMGELRAAERNGAGLIFLSPLFATRSHPGAASLGAYRFSAVARQARVPVMALGGVAPRHRRLIESLGATGFGAIDALT
jgi:thiamine-phosphate pyrophosphorylase